MEERDRMKKYRQTSPERTRASMPRSPICQPGRKVPVIYYLCRNRHLEHPHFMEVPLSSLQGLYLRDVIDRLTMLRGKGMPSLYSWSCKRSYKTGFVWHDLCEDDLIPPAHGNEYVLKGSELFEGSNSGYFSPIGNARMHPLKQLPGPVTSRSLGDSSSSSSVSGKEGKHGRGTDISLPLQHCGSFAVSPEHGAGKNFPWNGSLSLTEYTIQNNHRTADVSTQTEGIAFRPKGQDSSSSSGMSGKEGKHNRGTDISPPPQHCGSFAMSPEHGAGKKFPWNGSLSLTEYTIQNNHRTDDVSMQTEGIAFRPKGQDSCNRAVCTTDAPLELENSEVPCKKETTEICRVSVSPPPSTCVTSSCGPMETLESLIRADASKINSFRLHGEDELAMPLKFKATNMLMQLISCGSVSVKDHSVGLIPTYRSSHPNSKFPSPLFSTSVIFGDLDNLSDQPRPTSMKFEDKEFFSGSLIGTKTPEEGDGRAVLRRSSSFNAIRTEQLDSMVCKDEPPLARSKCIPLPIKTALSKHPRPKSMRSPLSGALRKMGDGANGSSLAPSESEGGSGRFTEPQASSKRVDPLKDEEKENVIKIEERLASGARVIIQSKT